MKRFANGNELQFNDLWHKLTGSVQKRIKYDVTLKPAVPAKIVFASSIFGVRVSLSAESATAAQDYSGDSEFIRSLLSGGEVEFTTLNEMKSKFISVRSDYAVRTQNAPESPAALRTGRESRIINPQELAALVKEQIIGQDAQIDGIALSVCNHLRKKNPKKPLTIMLPGPTGVGKTATARRMAEVLQDMYGKEQMPLIVIKCNEMQESHRVSQLLGSPAGYVGYGDASAMEPLKRTSSAVIVFDEFEKAHSSIHTSVMDWMDTGKITFSRINEGEESGEYDCAASIIILTSNISMGSPSTGIRFSLFDSHNAAPPPQEMSAQQRNEHCRETMKANGFKPEIAARIQYFFEYKELSEQDTKRVLELIFKNKAKEYGAIIDSISDRLLGDIHAYFRSSRFGVRPLENDLDNVLGQQIPTSVSSQDKRFRADGTLNNIIFTEV